MYGLEGIKAMNDRAAEQRLAKARATGDRAHGTPTFDSAMRLLARLPYRDLLDFADAIGADVHHIAEGLTRYEREAR